ncbi:hypothetical protein PENSPDRAFT_740252 [Peniophora sp. CONT]|nr:hypothetical protein PENSPDRAFT_740252 [Peniophora sp. CONT]
MVVRSQEVPVCKTIGKRVNDPRLKFATALHIDDLSPEILATVFKVINFECKPQVARRAPPRDIITLSHVSKRWREISVHLQTLWGSDLPCTSMDWTKLCLERCQTALFSFGLDYELFDASEEYYDAACLVFRHLSRAKAVQILEIPNLELAAPRSDDTKLWEFFAGLQQCASENIIELQIHMSEDDIFSVPFDLSLLFGPAVFPRIQSLTLWNIISPFNSSCHVFSHSLLSLQIEDSCAWQSVDEMIEVLRCVPFLEYFVHGTPEDMPDLRSHLFSPTISHMYPPRCVPLKHLKYLGLLGEELLVHHLVLFSYLDFPSNTVLILEGSRRAFSDDDGDKLTWESIKDLIEMAKTCLQKHFQPVTASGSFYPALRFREESLSMASTPIQLQAHGSSPATDVLPEKLTFGVPYIEVRDGRLEVGQSGNRLLDLYTLLPFLTRAITLLFYEDITQFTAERLEALTSVRRLIFTDIAPAIAFTAFCDAHDKVIFPNLERLELSFIASEGILGAESYLKVAEIFARRWGKTLRSVALEHTFFVEGEEAVVAGFKERLGDERVHVIYSEDDEQAGEGMDGNGDGNGDENEGAEAETDGSEQSRMKDDDGEP